MDSEVCVQEVYCQSSLRNNICEGERGKVGKREKLSHDAVATKASADLTWSSGAGMTLQIVPNSSKGTCVPLGKGHITLGRQFSFLRAIPGERLGCELSAAKGGGVPWSLRGNLGDILQHSLHHLCHFEGNLGFQLTCPLFS